MELDRFCNTGSSATGFTGPSGRSASISMFVSSTRSANFALPKPCGGAVFVLDILGSVAPAQNQLPCDSDRLILAQSPPGITAGISIETIVPRPGLLVTLK